MRGALLLEVVLNVVLKEFYCDFENLILVDFHHHYQVFEAILTNLNILFVASNCCIEPKVLSFEELAVKIGNPFGQDLENASVSLFDIIQ